MGIGRRPYPDYIVPIAFSDADKAEIAPFAKDHAAVFAKIENIHRQWTGMLAERRTECQQAIDNNRKILITLGFSEQEADATLRAQLLLHGWPDSDPLVTNINQPKAP